MNEKQPRLILSRRDVLKIMAVAGVAATGGYALFEYAPWLNYNQQAVYARRPFTKDAHPSVQMRELVRYAALAASGHNTQPWKFAIKENGIEIHPDFTRRLPAVDPVDRELWVRLDSLLAGWLPELPGSIRLQSRQ